MQENGGKEQYPTIDVERFGENLREICEAKNVTANELKDYLNLGSIQAVYMWFKGKRLPNLDNMYAISRYLGVSMDDLIGRERYEETVDVLCEDSLPVHGKRILLYWRMLRKSR